MCEGAVSSAGEFAEWYTEKCSEKHVYIDGILHHPGQGHNVRMLAALEKLHTNRLSYKSVHSCEQ